MRAPMTLRQVLGEALQARVSALLNAKKAARAIEEAGRAAGVEEGPVPIDPDLLGWLPTMQALTAEAERPLIDLAKELQALAQSEGPWQQSAYSTEQEFSPRGIHLKRAASYIEDALSRGTYARAAAEVLDSLKKEL